MFFRRRNRRRGDPQPPRSRNKKQQDYVHGSRPDLLPGTTGVGDDVEYFYEADALLVREEYMDAAVATLDYMGVRYPEDLRRGEPPGEAVVAGVRLIRLRRGADARTMLRLLLRGGAWRNPDGTGEVLIKGLGFGAASLNHLVHITGDAGCCPAVEPEPVDPGTERWPSATKDTLAGTGVKVVVVDTPIDPDTRDRTPWLAGVANVPDPVVPVTVPDSERYAGHGTFIAGLVRTMAPGAEVVVRALFENRGTALETELVQALQQVFEEDDPDIISLSAGTYTFENTGLMALEALYQSRMRHHKGVVLVAAAGNDGDRKPFFPAAAPFAVSVGALNPGADDLAWFTNRGGWVDMYAPGDGLINAYPPGPYTYQEAEEQPVGTAGTTVQFVGGLARWSGTSFSTPIVSGLIAARMSHTGENGHDAAAALVRVAQAAAKPGVGALLMPK